MKLHSFLLYAGIASLLVSCQKSYTPDGVVAPGTNPSGSMKLTKMEGKTRGNAEKFTMTFSYDASGRLILVKKVQTDSSNMSVTIAYRYVRDANGRVNSIVTNALSAGSPGSGMPDSIIINVHYPSASATSFDYSSYRVTLSGVSFADSTVYSWSGNNITDLYNYQAVASTTMVLAARTQYAYLNGNIPTIKIYFPSSGTQTLAATYQFEFDGKNQGLAVGNDAFLPGLDPSYYCKNNIQKLVATDNSGASQGFSLNYTYQYNPGSYPVAGTQTNTIDNGIADITFTYQ
ncbi:hypothetical protein [Sediminibacterium soli]|uniref:hypothetical protein n=1 Tax=Sediminibacterium soli TaxID=2698829 RepID=UPI0013796D5D|nr:hypothetical protein [Sediminibacterium soli]NCI48129.1 hypothetical protein [Sediminibacterium soli]